MTKLVLAEHGHERARLQADLVGAATAFLDGEEALAGYTQLAHAGDVHRRRHVGDHAQPDRGAHPRPAARPADLVRTLRRGPGRWQAAGRWQAVGATGPLPQWSPVVGLRTKRSRIITAVVGVVAGPGRRRVDPPPLRLPRPERTRAFERHRDARGQRSGPFRRGRRSGQAGMGAHRRVLLDSVPESCEPSIVHLPPFHLPPKEHVLCFHANPATTQGEARAIAAPRCAAPLAPGDRGHAHDAGDTRRVCASGAATPVRCSRWA